MKWDPRRVQGTKKQLVDEVKSTCCAGGRGRVSSSSDEDPAVKCRPVLEKSTSSDQKPAEVGSDHCRRGHWEQVFQGGGLREGNQSGSCWFLLIHLSPGLKMKQQQHSGWSLRPRGGGGAAAAAAGGGSPASRPRMGHLHKIRRQNTKLCLLTC